MRINHKSQKMSLSVKRKPHIFSRHVITKIIKKVLSSNAPPLSPNIKYVKKHRYSSSPYSIIISKWKKKTKILFFLWTLNPQENCLESSSSGKAQNVLKILPTRKKLLPSSKVIPWKRNVAIRKNKRDYFYLLFYFFILFQYT